MEKAHSDKEGMEARKLTSRKAGGVSGIHVEMVKVGGCTVVQWLKEHLMWLGNVKRHLKSGGGRCCFVIPNYMKGWSIVWYLQGIRLLSMVGQIYVR